MYNSYFDKGAILENESKVFVQEFEKRGENDAKALNFCTQTVINIATTIPNSKSLIDSDYDSISTNGICNLNFLFSP